MVTSVRPCKKSKGGLWLVCAHVGRKTKHTQVQKDNGDNMKEIVWILNCLQDRFCCSRSLILFERNENPHLSHHHLFGILSKLSFWTSTHENLLLRISNECPWSSWRVLSVVQCILKDVLFLAALCYSWAHARTHVTSQDIQHESQRYSFKPPFIHEYRYM